MTNRKIILATLLVSLPILLAATGCGGSVSVDRKGVNVNTKQLNVPALTFTVKYPATWDELTDDYVASIPNAATGVGIAGTESFAVFLRNDSRRERSAEELMSEAAGSGARSIAAEQHSGRPVVKIDLPGIDSKGRHGLQYSFAGGGKTWLLQCAWEDKNAKEVRDGCRGIVDSIKIKPEAASLTKVAYIAAADDICALAVRQTKPIEKRINAIDANKIGADAAFEQIADNFELVKGIVAPAIDSVAALAEPAEISSLAARYIDVSKRQVAIVDAVAAALRRNDSKSSGRHLKRIDSLSKTSKRLAKKIGFKKCD